MPFWKKSEDPWDRKPGPVKQKPVQPVESPEQPPAEELPAPETCPWCGQPLLAGHLYSNGTYAAMYWQEGPAPQSGFLASLLGEDTSGMRKVALEDRQRAWCCPACRRLVLDIPALHSGKEFEEALERRYQALQKKPKENDR